VEREDAEPMSPQPIEEWEMMEAGELAKRLGLPPLRSRPERLRRHTEQEPNE
jgi:hypothetical protein